MFCIKCKSDVEDCTCSDIEERMAALRGEGMFLQKVCIKCGKYYARCRCIVPSWRYDLPDGSTSCPEEN